MQTVKRILVIDDHPLFREGLRPLLRTLLPEAEIVGVDDVESALTLVSAGPAVHFVLIDLQLPRMNGLSAIALLRQLLPDTPMAVVSGSEQQSDARAALTAGAQGFVPKSMRPPDMLQALRQVLNGGLYVPPSMLGALLGQNPEPGAAGGLDENGLTQRQRQVLVCLCQGLSNKEIARRLKLTENTVKTHISAIFKTLDVMSRTQAVIAARSRGIDQA